MNAPSRLNPSFSTLSLFIKFSHIVRYQDNWLEYKTKTNYTLWNVYEGTVFIEINGQTFEASAGDSILFYPGDTYKAYCKENGCRFLFLLFALETENRLDFLSGKNLDGVYHAKELQDRCLKFCNEYVRSYHNKNTASLKFYSFCLSYLADLLELSSQCLHFRENAHSTQNLPINRILDYINSRFTEQIRMKDLAAYANMSEKYFIRYFRSYIKTSPKQYIIECRMKYAMELLASTDETLAAIAGKLGYSDQYSFSKAFRKYYNDSPSSFRKYGNHIP